MNILPDKSSDAVPLGSPIHNIFLVCIIGSLFSIIVLIVTGIYDSCHAMTLLQMIYYLETDKICADFDASVVVSITSLTTCLILVNIYHSVSVYRSFVYFLIYSSTSIFVLHVYYLYLTSKIIPFVFIRIEHGGFLGNVFLIVMPIFVTGLLLISVIKYDSWKGQK